MCKIQICEHTPVWGDIQLCDISLDEGSVAMVTIFLSVPLHKALHEVHGCHMGSLGQQVAGVTTANTCVSYSTLIKCSPMLNTSRTQILGILPMPNSGNKMFQLGSQPVLIKEPHLPVLAPSDYIY